MLREHGMNIHSTGGKLRMSVIWWKRLLLILLLHAEWNGSDVISNDRIVAGDVIVGFASFGQTSYESEYNGGIGAMDLLRLVMMFSTKRLQENILKRMTWIWMILWCTQGAENWPNRFPSGSFRTYNACRKISFESYQDICSSYQIHSWWIP